MIFILTFCYRTTILPFEDQHMNNDHRAVIRATVTGAIRDTLSEIELPKTIESRHTFKTLGACSLDCIQLQMTIEKTYNIHLDDDEDSIVPTTTVGELINLVDQKLQHRLLTQAVG